METFEARRASDTELVLKNKDDLDRVYTLISKDENFILQWKSHSGKDIPGQLCSQVFISANVSAKVKSGAIILRSEE
jgi:hypothetical protein